MKIKNFNRKHHKIFDLVIPLIKDYKLKIIQIIKIWYVNKQIKLTENSIILQVKIKMK
jgi:hypothetical protein